MSNIKNLKSELNKRKALLPAKLEETTLQELDILISNNRILEHYIQLVKKENFIRGMNQTSIILFEESIDEL